MSIKQAIQNYLKEQQAQNIAQEAAQIKEGYDISVHYIGRTGEEAIFDTSVEEIAKVADMHNPQRDYTNWLKFTVGAGQMIPGFDKAVQGMRVGETKTVTLAPEDAYGHFDPQKVIEVPMDKLPTKEWGFQVGDMLYTQQWQALKITKIEADTVHLDHNHHLAGQELIFDITIIDIHE